MCASASFPPTQQSVSLEMRRRAWRKSGRLIRPPPSPSQLPFHSHLCCLYAASVVRQQFTEWGSNNTGSLAFMSLLAALFVCPSPLFCRKKEPVLVGQSQPFSPGPQPRSLGFFSFPLSTSQRELRDHKVQTREKDVSAWKSAVGSALRLV